MTTDEAYAVAGWGEKIEVDIGSLSDYALAMRREFEEHLLPAWKRANQHLIDRGSRFGLSPELELDEKRQTYDLYLMQAQRFLQSVIEGTRQLAEAADQIGANYSRADQFAKLQADDVHKVLPQLPTDTIGTTGGRVRPE